MLIHVLQTLFIFLILLLLVILGVYFLLIKGGQEPEHKRKWADPKFHD